MRSKTLFPVIFLAVSSVFAANLNLTGTVKAVSENGNPIENAVVLLKMNNNLIAYARTLSDEDGKFNLLGVDAPGEIVPVANPVTPLSVNYNSYQALDLRGRAHNLSNLAQGIYVLLGKTENGKNVNLGTIYHRGGTLKTNNLAQKEQKIKSLPKSTTASGDEVQLIVRKTGYLPTEVDIKSFEEDVGTVVLKRDPLEDRIDSVLALMNLDDKIYQMTQPIAGNYVNSSGNIYGSVLHGGGGYYDDVLPNSYNAVYSGSNTNIRAKIPVTYGKDMVHGAAEITGATVFPHNIGMGATRDSAIVRKACEITAKESWAGNVDLIFGPAISVPQDERWGRVYEGFGETAELAVMMGPACVRGFQGEKYNAPWRVIATAKHYLADGSTTDGIDRGDNATITDEEVRAVHLPGYEAVVEQGVLSVMASFNQIRGTHQHVDSLRLTGWLKTELGFDGYIISDWDGIDNSLNPGFTDGCNYGSCTGVDANKNQAIKRAINAGIDLAMEPNNASGFISSLRTLVNSKDVSEDRIDDAVRRILRAKFRAGRMDSPNPQNVSSLYSGTIGSPENRAVAREAVRKSLVLLKNENSALPISKNAKVYVAGTHADNTGYQCGGWTLGWQGTSWGVSGATSIQAGIDLVAPGARVTQESQADVIIYVTGETPYAEWEGDRSLNELNFTDLQLATLKSQYPGKKIITVFISGRAMVVENLLSNSDAFVAAWLPGSEGAGVADVLFGDYNFTGKLPHTWPRNLNVIPINSTEQSDNWFPYGFGLSY